MANTDLEKIKKYYGEDFAKLCRDIFSSILEQENDLYQIISRFFAPSKSLYQDIIENDLIFSFKYFVYSQFDKTQKQTISYNAESPFDIMKKAGYKLYKCKTNKDVLSFKKYWKENEELCTFKDPERINTHIIYFAVKNDVDKIKREDFLKPLRQDQYGTSVISIHFSKGSINNLSIKNRYNHTVNNPDATFSNNLESIYPGLTESFIKEENLTIEKNSNSIEIPNYETDVKGKLYKYNCEINNVHYCENNIVIDHNGIVHQYNKDKYELVDYFLIDKQLKKITNLSQEDDSFIDSMQEIQKIEINKLDKSKIIKITTPEGEQKIIVNKNNSIIGYENKNLKKVGNFFLFFNKNLTKIDLPNVTKIGEHFLYYNMGLTELDLPNASIIGKRCLFYNKGLTKLDLPNVTEIYDDFLFCNRALTNIELPKITKIGKNCLHRNKGITKIDLPNVTEINNEFLYYNEDLKELDLPNITKIGNDFLYCNEVLKELDMPNVTEIGDNFLYCNKGLLKLDLPNVTEIKNKCLYSNEVLTELNLPNVIEIGGHFLCWNKGLTKINLSNVTKIGNDFLLYNKGLTKIDLPNVTEIGNNCLCSSNALTKIALANVTKIGDDFLCYNKVLKKIDLPNVTKIGNSFLYCNKDLKKIDLPNLTEHGDNFLKNNQNIKDKDSNLYILS